MQQQDDAAPFHLFCTVCTCVFPPRGTRQVIDFKGENAVLPPFVPCSLIIYICPDFFFGLTLLTCSRSSAEELFGKSCISREHGTAMTTKRLTS